jgi:uncharacterized protein involved in type VI secretion and phage assembly
MNQFFGKYRGKVEGNVDPMQLGRIRISVSAVLGEGCLSWAMPCVPYAGPNVGFFVIPPVGGNIWVEFEGGDPDYPIWSGCFWDTGEAPASPAVAEMKVLKTDSGTITLNDQKGSGGITIETTSGLKIVMGTQGIELSNGSQKIAISSGSISLNNGALEVT